METPRTVEAPPEPSPLEKLRAQIVEKLGGRKDDAQGDMLVALNRTGKPVYEGTVPHATKQRNRAANKRARGQRRINRLKARR